MTMKQHQGTSSSRINSSVESPHFTTLQQRLHEILNQTRLSASLEPPSFRTWQDHIQNGPRAFRSTPCRLPLALRPTPEQLDDARERLDKMAFNDLQLLFDAIFATHTYIVRVYQLDQHCKTLHHDLQRDFAAEVNEDILMGTCPPNQRKQTLYPEWPFACPCYRTSFRRSYTPKLHIQKSQNTSPRNSMGPW